MLTATLVGVKAKSDTSDARLLASYAAAPDEVRGRKAGHVELPEDAIREALSELASRRDQLKHMIHAETCRLGTVRMAELRQAITTHLEALRAEDKQVHRMMLALVRQRLDLQRDQRLLKTIKGIGVKSALALLASVPELGRIDNKAAAALIGVAPFVRKSGTMTAPARIHGGRAAVRSILYMAAVTASRHNPVLRPFYERLIAKGKPPKARPHRRASPPRRLRQCRAQVRPALERRYRLLTVNTVDPRAKCAIAHKAGTTPCFAAAGRYPFATTTFANRRRIRIIRPSQTSR